MFQQMRRQRKHAAFHFNGGHVFSFKFFRHVIISAPRINFRTAGVNIDGSKIKFGPRMNRQMRFGDHHHAGDAVRIKRMKNDIDNPGMRMLGGFHHDGFNFVHIIENFAIAVVELNQ